MSRATDARLRRPRRGPSRRWMLVSACLEATDLPWLADQVPAPVAEQMRQVCADCPVRHHCANYVEAAGITGGFWAGQPRWGKGPSETPGRVA